jgi:hypothetical protein
MYRCPWIKVERRKGKKDPNSKRMQDCPLFALLYCDIGWIFPLHLALNTLRSAIAWLINTFLWVLLDGPYLLLRPPYLLLRPPYLLLRPPYTKGALYTSAINYFGIFVMTFHHRQRLKLAPVS